MHNEKNQQNWRNRMLYPPASLLEPTGPIRPKAVSAPDPLREAAQKLEASFLAEMLKAAGLGKTSESFGGGAGEDQFASFLRQAQAEEMVRSGGIGLAESLYHALKERQNV
jgi:peptidoglycan hydrolase FlgJ